MGETDPGEGAVRTVRFATLIGRNECSVGVRPVGDVRIEYIGDGFSQGQSTDAAPLTELFDF